MTAATQNFDVNAGETFLKAFRYGTKPLVTKAITMITQAAPPQVTAAGHGLVAGWPAAVVSAQGMTQINSPHYPPRSSDWTSVTIIDGSNVTLDDVNSSDFTAYSSGGFLVYPTPVDLTSMTGSFSVFDNPEHTGTPLLTETTAPGLVFDNTAKKITVQFETAALGWTTGYFELVVIDSASVKRELINGVINILP